MIGNVSGKPTHSFYSLPEFKEWKDEQTNIKQWNIKYYKGFYFSYNIQKVENHEPIVFRGFDVNFEQKNYFLSSFNPGLGTSTGPEAKEYFSDMGRHKIRFR